MSRLAGSLVAAGVSKSYGAEVVLADVSLVVPRRARIGLVGPNGAGKSTLLLLLDEPTNDLDFAGLAWLERSVASHPGALVVVSHDRAFLDRVVTRIVELDEWTRRTTEYSGGGSDYEAERERRRE